MDTHTITIVTAYYPLAKSKHTLDDYKKWYTNFFNCVTANVICFIPGELEAEFKKLIKSNHTLVCRRFDSFEMMSSKYMKLWNAFYRIDPENKYHSPELYAVWAAKQEIVREAIKTVTSDIYVWCDIGCFRTIRNGSFSLVNKYIVPKKITCLYLKEYDTIGGGVLAGDRAAWLNFSTSYITELNKNPHGKDQEIYKRILNKDSANIIEPTGNYEIWFYLTFIFSCNYENPLSLPNTDILVDVLGGLGNQLYHMALFEYLKQQYTNRKIVLQFKREVDRHINLNYFDSILKNWKTDVNNDVPYSRIISEQNLNPIDVLNISTESTILYGYFQTYKYITDSFINKLSFSNEILEKYPNIQNMVFIHIRGGDYLEGRYAVHRIDLTTYYEKAIKCFDKDTQFCIFTNDIVHAKSFSFLQSINHIFIEEDQLDTLNLMRHCKGGICANSTFSWWGARLNPNRTLTLPSKWFNDTIRYTDDYYFPEATIIDIGMWDFIDKVVYINLDHRTDRNEHMKKMTRTFGNKVSRFSAIKNENGNIGCSMSHISVLKNAIENNYENILILEDDAEWNNFEEGYQILNKLLSNPYDVIVLGGSYVSYNSENYKLNSCQTTTGYLVNKHYMQTLLSNFEESCSHLTQNPTMETSYALDVYWQRLQRQDTWFIIQPPLVYQIPCYSDISTREVDYRSLMGIADRPLLPINHKQAKLSFLRRFS